MNTSQARDKGQWRQALQARRLARVMPTDQAFFTQVSAFVALSRAVALFAPTAAEPDFSRVFETPGSWLLPRLFTGEGTPLPVGSWGWYGDGLERPRHSWPAQPKRSLGPQEWGQIDLVLVPALAVDLSGTRLGKGGGWYDRALSAFPGVPRFAVTFADEVYPAGTLPVQAHDLPMDGVITEMGTQSFPVH